MVFRVGIGEICLLRILKKRPFFKTISEAAVIALQGMFTESTNRVSLAALSKLTAIDPLVDDTLTMTHPGELLRNFTMGSIWLHAAFSKQTSQL